MGKVELQKQHLNKVEVMDVKKYPLQGFMFLFSLHFLYQSSSCTLSDVVIPGETKGKKAEGAELWKIPCSGKS